MNLITLKAAQYHSKTDEAKQKCYTDTKADKVCTNKCPNTENTKKTDKR